MEMEELPIQTITSKSGKKMSYLTCSSCRKWVAATWLSRHVAKCKVSLFLPTHKKAV
jgi:hypothetical protein